MAVTVQQLVAPRGELEPALFPAGDLMERVSVCILEGYEKAADLTENQDAAVAAYVHYRIYTAVARRLAVEPERAEVDDLARTYNVKQASTFQALADRFKAEFDSYIPTAAAQPTKSRPRGSASIATEAVW
jgi:hypothetical protein